MPFVLSNAHLLLTPLSFWWPTKPPFRVNATLFLALKSHPYLHVIPNESLSRPCRKNHHSLVLQPLEHLHWSNIDISTQSQYHPDTAYFVLWAEKFNLRSEQWNDIKVSMPHAGGQDLRLRNRIYRTRFTHVIPAAFTALYPIRCSMQDIQYGLYTATAKRWALHRCVGCDSFGIGISW